ncbi:MAG: hypothetical protein JRN20_07705 [Nitrososphaerota archaeon]|nr:hypothetical protein [Nitrososphaerota archaeon]
MGNAERDESETLNDLKAKLWIKIQVLDARLSTIDEKSEDYPKTMDAYHKIMKSYMDIVRIQHYAPGSLVNNPQENDFAKLVQKVHRNETLTPTDKIALMEFKEFLDYTKKIPLGLGRKNRK